MPKANAPHRLAVLSRWDAAGMSVSAKIQNSSRVSSYLALLERSVLFHALIVLDGLGGDGGGDLAGVGYLCVGSR